MNVAIVGFGRMGKLIYDMLKDSRNDAVSAVIDPVSPDSAVTALKADSTVLSGADVVIDFSAREAMRDNIALYSELGIPAVIGTTGWYRDREEIRSIAGEKAKIICSGNFSLGVAIFLRLAEAAGRLIDSVDSYDVAISEIHHREKADAPSGTALMAAEKLLSVIGRKKGVQIGNPDGKIGKDLINISSLRTGMVPGTHTVMMDGVADTITITHTARTREGFAEGAIKAAGWIIGKEPGIYTMDDFTDEMMGGIKDA